MPKRIPFHIVYATSEDPNYPACELNAQSPAARGWRSAGLPPHELLLRLAFPAAIHRLQLLAHHQLVPSCVEVLVSGGIDAGGAATPCGALYTSVGKVSLAKPDPQARTRELRSAALTEPTVARFVKLRLSGPHPPSNENDQVALMAVNVLGEDVEKSNMDKTPTSNKAEPDYSPYDDLAFVMYVDSEIADLVRKLDERKRNAVVEERFEYARRLKSAATALAAAGVRIGRWRLRKRIAAAKDDFELARRMRDRITDALVAIKEDVEVCRLLEEEGPDPLNDSSMPKEYDFSHHLSPSVAAGALSFDMPSPIPPQDPDHHDSDEVCNADDGEYLNEDAEVNGDNIDGEVKVLTVLFQFYRADRGANEHETHQKAGDTAAHLSRQCVAGLLDRNSIFDEQKSEPMEWSYVHETQAVQTEKIEAQKKPDEDEIKKEADSPRRSVTPNAANGGTLVRRRNKSAGPRSTFEAYEERLLPALRHSHTNEYLKETREEEGSGTGSAGTPRAPHKLNERERKQAALPIIIFGYPLVEKFYAKNFLDKEEGLARLRSELTSPSPNGSTKTSPNKTARAAATLLQRSLRDKVFSVYSQANEVVRVLFQEFMPERVCSAEVGRCLEKLLPELLRASGDPAPRIHSTAQHTILTVAECPHVRSLHIIPQQLVRPVQASMHPRLALSRLQMLEQLILSHGISTDKNSGLTVRRLAECGAAGTQHAAGAVRAAAERILVAAYHRSPRVVRAQLPPDDAVTRRNLIYRHLFQQFDRIDMEKILSQAPTEEQLSNGNEHSMTESNVETSSISQSTRSAMTSSLGATSSYSIKSMTSSVSGSTLAPSSLSSMTTSKTKSSLKRSPTKRYVPSRTTRDFTNYPGYNKLRLDSAVSPKHSPRSSSAGNEKVHFQESRTEEVVLRRANRNADNRHSMIHYDHESDRPQLKERPVTVYEPLHADYRDFTSYGSPKTSKTELQSMDSLPTDSPRMSKNDIRCIESTLDKCSDYYKGVDSPKVKDGALGSPRMTVGLRNLRIDDSTQMDESGYYSPGETRSKQQVTRSKSGTNVAEYCDRHFESFEAGVNADLSSGGTTPEPVCNAQCTWCGRWVRAGGLDAHYWRRCVLLARCPHCHHALEARTLHAHLLEECSMSPGAWKQCAKCGAALRAEDSDLHAHCTR
ncbi:Centrosomal protein of 104 kDa [Eumeta japonica]|uniref:Centrosomal protein of 104 kDa n=1 Tax=Eumeta variegata TaxID=151549 RepID=A0A4C1U379_EUMVA|nr:Centrosomal protein of 104 kDa [Eumeta japonica]